MDVGVERAPETTRQFELDVQLDAPGIVDGRLQTVNWDFAHNPGRAAIHDLHPYPARFVPELPRELIRLFHPGDDSAVFDPFCGCGTTLVESQLLGIHSIGVDLNPLAVLISKVKTTPLSNPLLPVAQEIASQREMLPTRIPPIPRLDHWFNPPVQQALAALTAGINSVRDESVRDALRVSLSRILVRVSNQESDTRYAAVDKNISEAEVYELFVRSSAAVESAINGTHASLFAVEARSQVIESDVLALSSSVLSQPVGLVVTSPPYPNAYEYWLYHKYRMYWLGMDPIAVRNREIGARPHYFKKNHQTETDFANQMSVLFSLLADLLLPGRYACFVVGRSVIHGRTIDNVALLAAAAASEGFNYVGSANRTIARNRKSFNLSHAGIEQETIVVFERVSNRA